MDCREVRVQIRFLSVSFEGDGFVPFGSATAEADRITLVRTAEADPERDPAARQRIENLKRQ